MEVESSMQENQARRGLVETTALVALALMIVTVLYVARELLVPLALAILLSFALAPLVRVLRALGVPRTLSVVAAVIAAFAVLAAIGWLITAQISQLVADLPSYQDTVQRKISSLKGATATSSALEKVSEFLNTVSKELAEAPPEATRPVRPLTVRVLEPAAGPLSNVVALLQPLLHPFAMTGIVIIFVVFILLQREDLRNRFIKLVGTRDLQKTTVALDDAARRLSKLLLIQLALNSGFGFVVGVGLWIIGVPIPVLWGILSAVLRFVPYVGAIVSSALPLALAAAVDPGWTMLLWTAALFLITEPIVGHFIEPAVFGKTTGLSPVAVVVAATFWTWLWGPIGLLLATPLTVCLVVLGRHVKGLNFLEVVLGDRPALSAVEMFYQRALSGDSAEIVGVAEEILKERSLSDYYDQIAVGGLRLAAEDAERGLISPGRVERIRDTIEDVVADLADHEDAEPGETTVDSEAAEALEETADRTEAPVPAEDAIDPAWRGDPAVLCVGAESPLDEASASLLAQLVGKHGLKAKVAGPEALSARGLFQLGSNDTRAVCLTALSTTRSILLRNAVRRVRRRLPGARIILVVPGGVMTVPPDAYGAAMSATSFRDTVTALIHEATRKPETPGERGARLGATA